MFTSLHSSLNFFSSLHRKLVDQIDKDGDGKVTSKELRDWIQFSKTQQHLDAAGKRWEDTKIREEKLVSRSDLKGDKSMDPMGPLAWGRYKRMSFGPDPGIGLHLVFILAISNYSSS